MGRKKIMRCYICKELINEEDCIYNEVQKDKNKNIKTDKNGNILYKISHNNCFIEKENKKKEKDDLYQYILRTYYTKELPIYLIQRLQEINKTYSYVVIRECLEASELSIRRYFKDTGNAIQKVNYIISVIQNNIDDFYTNKIFKEKESHFKKKEVFENSANNSTPLKPPKSINKYDLSFLE
jgi:hypothetical protein